LSSFGVVIVSLTIPFRISDKLCFSGDIKYCKEDEWCDYNGGKYFNGGFGAGRCVFPEKSESIDSVIPFCVWNDGNGWKAVEGKCDEINDVGFKVQGYIPLIK